MKVLRAPNYLAAAIALITLLVFLPALRNDFVIWDDETFIVGNYHLRSLNADFFKWAATDLSYSIWQPGAWLSHALDYALWGLNPAGHHLSSVLLHAINTFLVVFLIIRLLEAGGTRAGMRAGGDPSPLPDERTILITGAAVGVLFGLHPLHVEPAVWLTGRTDLICALFFLLSVIAYTRFATGSEDRPFPKGSWTFFLHRQYILSFVFFILALSGKPTAITLPFVLLILDWYPFGRVRAWKDLAPALIEKIPFVLVSIMLSFLTLASQKGLAASDALEGSFLTAQVTASAEALVLYLWKMLVPLHLLPVYPFPENMSSLSVRTIFMMVIVAGMSIAAIIMARKRPVIAAAWFYFLVTIFPTLGLVGIRNSFMADRYMYLPSLGLFLLMGLAAAHLWSWTETLGRGSRLARTAVLAAGGLICILMISLTEKQISVWKSSIDLWSHVISYEPNRSPIAYNNRGLAFKEKGQFDRAMDDYNRSIALVRDARPYTNRGILHGESGDLEKAMEDFNAAIELDPGYADAYTSRGLVLVKTGALEPAIEDFNTAISLNPASVDVWLNRGVALENAGRLDRALEDYSRALALNPGDYLAYGNRGALFMRMGRMREAVEDLTTAISLKPDFSGAYLDRGNCFWEQGNAALALQDFRKACDLGSDAGCAAMRSHQTR